MGYALPDAQVGDTLTVMPVVSPEKSGVGRVGYEAVG